MSAGGTAAVFASSNSHDSQRHRTRLTLRKANEQRCRPPTCGSSQLPHVARLRDMSKQLWGDGVGWHQPIGRLVHPPTGVYLVAVKQDEQITGHPIPLSTTAIQDRQ